MTETTRKPGPDPKTLLHLSEQFLRRRYFTDCRKYAHQAHQIDPKLAGVTQILAVADVFLAATHHTPTGNTLRDWYQVLQLNRYTNKPNLINKQYNQLYSLLNPVTNKLPFADEAFEIVCDAWSVLSDRVKKSEFDCLLKQVVADDGVKADRGNGFWTVCPYCYYLYEYDRVYLELCVKCPNDECGRAFTSVEIEPPPGEVLEVGKYVCDGFVMLGLKTGCWNPFAPVGKKNPNLKQNPKPNYGDDSDKFVTISDDDVEVKRNEGVEGVQVEVNVSTVKPNGRRKKSAARNMKKVTGAGNRVCKEAFLDQEQSDDCEFF